MIVSKLSGGLGNQLFQYAAGRRLAHARGTALVLDLGWYRHMPSSNTPRTYELDRYPLEARPPSGLERLWCRLHHGRVLGRMPWFPRAWRHVRERGFAFDGRVLELPDDVYLDGYWQSYKYFSDVAEMLRKELTPVTDMGPVDQVVAGAIASGPAAVSLHVRRGDYVSNAAAARVHGLCSLDYYARAVAYMAARLTQPHFFVFSDDMPWVRANLHLPGVVSYVDHNGPENAFQDLRLMALCRHHIIANSSFSWWGAWLGGGVEQQVVAPRGWFADGRDTGDLTPPGWVRL